MHYNTIIIIASERNFTSNGHSKPERDELINKSFKLKGKWNKDFFKNENPIVLEFGCGKGEYTTTLSKWNNNVNYIGIDIKGARIWKGAKDSFENHLKNVCFITSTK